MELVNRKRLENKFRLMFPSECTVYGSIRILERARLTENTLNYPENNIDRVTSASLHRDVVRLFPYRIRVRIIINTTRNVRETRGRTFRADIRVIRVVGAVSIGRR